jgi:Acetyltransferase (GNAT) domain
MEKRGSFVDSNGQQTGVVPEQFQGTEVPASSARGQVAVAEKVSAPLARYPEKPECGSKAPERRARSAGGRHEDGMRYLEADEYAAWDALVDASPQGSLFCKSWWLRAIGGETAVLGYFESGRLVAGMPLYFEKRMGLRFCCMPELTQTWGVVIEQLSGRRVSTAARETRIVGAFAQRLARERMFFQAFHCASANWLPFYWNGFKQTTRYTYVLDDLQSLDRVWEGFEQNTRSTIRKAQKLGVVVSPCTPEVVFDGSAKTHTRQQKRHPYPLEYLRRLYDAARENGAGECFAAQDREGRVHDTALLVWDSKRAYNLAGGGDPSLRSSGAGSLLVWHSIQFAASRTSVFDFEGSMIQPIEHFFRSFGSKQVAYHLVMKFPSWFRACLCLAGKI